MTRFKIYLFLLLTSVLLPMTLGAKEKGFAKKVFKTMENLPGILGQAVELWQVLDSFITMFQPQMPEAPTTDDRLDALQEKMDELSSDMVEFENRMNRKIEHVGYTGLLEARLNRLFTSIEKIDSYYKTFLDYTNDTLIFLEVDMEDFLDEIQKYNPIKSHLEEMHRAFGSSDLLSKNIPMLLQIPSISFDHMCALGQSSQQTILFLFQQMMMAEVKAYAMLMYANEYKKAVYNVTVTSHNEQTRHLFETRTNSTFEIVEWAMEQSSREVWSCDSEYPKEGEDYVRVGPVFQRYILNELHAYNIRTKKDGCRETCKDLKLAKYHNYTGSHDFSKHLDVCHGNVRDCETKGQDNSYCVAHDGYRRYEFVRYDDEIFGRNDKPCPLSDDINRNNRTMWYFWDCWHCLCTCESDDNAIDTYFSLLPAIADNNKVVAGVRLKLVDNIFHIQIKQGKLLPSGRVLPDDDWTPIKNNPQLKQKALQLYVYKLSWDTKSVLLDDFDSSLMYKENHVLTGLGFKNLYGQLRLRVYLSKFNHITGELERPREHTRLDSAHTRSLIPMDELDLPDGYKNNVVRSAGNEYLKFTTSSFKKDAGQTVLPFIDIQPIETNPPIAYSGAGLFLRADEKQESGGYLALKLFTVDTVSYLKTPELDVNTDFEDGYIG